jgi:hypothetical protein
MDFFSLWIPPQARLHGVLGRTSMYERFGENHTCRVTLLQPSMGNDYLKTTWSVFDIFTSLKTKTNMNVLKRPLKLS